MTKVLCRLDELAETGAKGVALPDGPMAGEGAFVVRGGGDEVYCYVNSCPHIGTPLDLLPDRFLTRDRRQILCTTHGARFEIATGFCVAGPCRGRSLRRLPVKIEKGVVMLAD